MPAAPSASYFAPGLVITSMLFTTLAGMLLKIIDGLLENITLGIPSTYTLKDDEPLTVMLSWPSTVTIGTLRSMSSTVYDFESSSSLTL